jgi:MoxR-like ATPase
VTEAVARSLLDRLDLDEYGTGEPSSGVVADDRSGRYWLVTDHKIRLALKVALITGRPLLVEGPSGSGKSSLARAVAATLDWPYYEKVVTSQTTLDDLLGYVDVVRRLHEAELAGRGGENVFPRGLEAFLEPGVLWWAFDPESAKGVGTGREDPAVAARPTLRPAAEGGTVVLIDEIDKAEPDLPNNLLVPLGSLEFRVEGRDAPVKVSRRYRPLVIVTSNQERDLPPAFLRRCVVLELDNPTPDDLKRIALNHVGASAELVDEVFGRFVGPGPSLSPAEFVDAVRAVVGLGLRVGDDPKVWDDVNEVMRRSGR